MLTYELKQLYNNSYVMSSKLFFLSMDIYSPLDMYVKKIASFYIDF